MFPSRKSQLTTRGIKMTTFFLIILFHSSVFLSHCANYFISYSVSQIIREFYLNRSEAFDFIIHGTDTENLAEIVNKILRKEESFTSNLITLRDGEESGLKINRSAVLMFNNVASYQDFHSRAVLNNFFPRNFYFLVYIRDLNAIQLNNLIPNSMLKYENFLVQNKKTSIVLATFVIFQQPDCRALEVQEINTFSIQRKMWEKSEFFPNKFDNFNGCELVAKISYQLEPGNVVDFDDNGKIAKVWGFGPDLNQIIADNLNYTIHFKPCLVSAPYKCLNESLETDFMIHQVALRLTKKFGRSFLTHPLDTSESLFLISRSIPYTQFEKLFLPFDIDTWIWLIITLSAAVVVIFFLKFTSKHVQDFVYGTQVTTPILNLM